MTLAGRGRGLAVAGIAAGVVLVLFWLQGVAPGTALREIARGSFGTATACVATLRLFAPLCLCALGIAVAFRAGIFNIGAEGQWVAGAIAAVAAAGPAGHWLPALLAGTLAGGLWAAIPAVLRVWRDVPEILSTIMLNFVAVELLRYCIAGPLQEPTGQFLQSASLPAAAELPEWTLPGSPGMHLGIPLAAAAALAVHVLLQCTRPGLLVRAAGSGPRAVQSGGFSLRAVLLGSFLVSGTLAGLAGALEITGVAHVLDRTVVQGIGYAAISVALLARLSPLLVLPAALLFAALLTGTAAIQWVEDLPGMDRFAQLLQGLVILAVLYHLATSRSLRSWKT